MATVPARLPRLPPAWHTCSFPDCRELGFNCISYAWFCSSHATPDALEFSVSFHEERLIHRKELADFDRRLAEALGESILDV